MSGFKTLSLSLQNVQEDLSRVLESVERINETNKIIQRATESINSHLKSHLAARKDKLERLTEALRAEVLNRINKGIAEDGMSQLSQSEICTLEANAFDSMYYLIDIDPDLPVDDDVQAIAAKVHEHLGSSAVNLFSFCHRASRHNTKTGETLRRAWPPSVEYARGVLLEMAKELEIQDGPNAAYELDIQFAQEFLEAHASTYDWWDHNRRDEYERDEDDLPLFAEGDSVDPQLQELRDEILRRERSSM
ncbi:hypothetical protein B0H16DRAFT_1711698 [Mycena metata]|uniref:Uncharacterized protein n=1 Tax=Mycena metata TaxID=1033252 RepID=A0AAD7K4N2_9AGAR|nr:hypothetical protein B0H16DRAFT_1711698 [Mycena metata]